MSLITAATAKQLAIGMSARCTTITCAAWANGGQALIVAHGNGLSIWAGGFDARPDHVFAAEAPLRALAVSRLRPIAAVGSHDGSIRLWNTESWQHEPALPVQMHQAAVTALAFHPARAILASGDALGNVYQYDLNSARFMKLSNHGKEVTSLAYTPDGACLASGSWDQTAHLSTAATGALIHTLPHPDWVRALTFTPDGASLLTACRDGQLRVWSLDGELRSTIPAHDGGLDCVAISPDGSLTASGGRDGALRLWQTESLIPLTVLNDAHTRPVLTLTFRPQGDFLISGGGDNWLHLWEIPAVSNAPDAD